MGKRLKKYLACQHRNVQQFTEMCLDCGENIYTSVEEIKREEKQKKAKKDEDENGYKWNTDCW